MLKKLLFLMLGICFSAMPMMAVNSGAVVTTTVTVQAEPQSSFVKKADKWKAKVAKKALKQNAGGIDKAVYIILAILGLGWLGMGLNDDFQDMDWLISLLLYMLFWLPGFIYTLVKMKKYY